MGCPIRKSAHQRLFAPTRSLSQLITSFIASVSQGIRHAPFITFFLPTSLIKNLIIEVHKKYSKKKEKEKARSPYFQLYCLKNKNIAVYILIYSLACVNMSKNGGQKGTKHIIICNPLSEVENNGFEPLTPCLQSRCSSQLS